MKSERPFGIQKGRPKLCASIHLPWSAGIPTCILERFQLDRSYPAGSSHAFRRWTYFQQMIPISLHLTHNLGGGVKHMKVLLPWGWQVCQSFEQA